MGNPHHRHISSRFGRPRDEQLQAVVAVALRANAFLPVGQDLGRNFRDDFRYSTTTTFLPAKANHCRD